MSNILVTGGAGFIGSHVVRAFLERGDQVTALDDLSSGKRANVPEGVTLVEDDVRSESAARLVKDGGFDVVCHLAAQIDVRRSLNDPKFDADVNVAGTLNVLEAIRASGKANTRVVFSSTAAAYGDFVVPPTLETAGKDPQSPYGCSKFAVEYYLAYYGRIHGIDTVALRYGNVYGPRQDSHGEAGVVALFCERILDGRPLKIFGDGLQTRDFVYAGDVAAANVCAATAPLPPAGSLDSRAYNVATATETEVLTLANTLKQIAKADTQLEHVEERPGEIRRSALDISKATRELGWTPVRSLQEGLEATYEWFASEYATTQASAR